MRGFVHAYAAPVAHGALAALGMSASDAVPPEKVERRGGPLAVRDARASDLPAIRELTLRAYGEYAGVMAPSAWAGLERAVLAGLEADRSAARILAERDGELVGSVMLFRPAAQSYGVPVEAATWPELRLLAVAPEARGQHVARTLVDACIRRAREWGATDLGLHTSESMRAAIRLYESMGFERAPEFDFQPEGAELVMAYRLRIEPGVNGG